MKILLIEHKQLSLAELASYITKQEDKVTVLSINNAFEKITNTEYDCVVLSVRKNIEEWVQIVELLNNKNRTDGLIIISENSSLEFMVNCFDLGIDEFLAQPFQIPVLYARLKAVVRRRKFNTKRNFYFSNLMIDFHLKKIYVIDKEVNFTLMEYQIILHLFSNKNQPKSKESIVQYLWDESLSEIKLNNVLFTHIKNIRMKLKKAKAKVNIKNNYGLGYQIKEL